MIRIRLIDATVVAGGRVFTGTAAADHTREINQIILTTKKCTILTTFIEFEESLKREPLIPVGAPLDYVPKPKQP